MIQDLDKSLQTLLARELSPAVTVANILFDAPDKEFTPKSTAINCFLYDIRENRELRSNEWLLERKADGSATQSRSPVRVDCSYLVTVWANNIETEHRILGDLVKVFSTYATIPDDVLPESLHDQQPVITLQPGQLDNLVEFWQALGAKPKPALTYTATISVEAHKPEEVKLVEEKIIDLRVEKDITL